MDIRLIVFGMVTILIALFIGAKFFVPKEKDKSQKEALFVESVSAFLKNPNQENYDICFRRASELPHLKNKGDNLIKDFLSKNKVVI